MPSWRSCGRSGSIASGSSVRWLLIAPQPGSARRPSGFNAADPGAYPAANWVTLDRIVTQAAAQHFDLNLDVVGGAPLWATVAGAPRDGRPHYNWAPKAREFELFMRALAIRYSGTYDPTTDRQSADDPNDLPAMHFWSIWNEPNYGPSLAPQGDPHEAGHSSIERSAWTYRNLLDAGWSALHATGHGGDTILFGEVAPRGGAGNKLGLFNGTTADAVSSCAVLRRLPVPDAPRPGGNAAWLSSDRRGVPSVSQPPPRAV